MKFRISRTFDAMSQPTDDATPNGDRWEIEIATLDDLLALCQKEGQIVVIPPDEELAAIDPTYVPTWLIEIYDQLRE